MKLFGGIFASLFGTAEEYVEKDTDSSTALEAELQRAWDEVQKQAAKQATKEKAKRRTRDGEQKKKRQHDDSKEELWETIQGLHLKLGSGLDSEMIQSLSCSTLGHAFGPREPIQESLEERIEYYVLRELFHRCAERAWTRLQSLMESSSEDWPVPPDLTYRRSPESAAKFARKRLEELRTDFTLAPPIKQAELAVGEVKVWRHTYPERDSWLWLQTGLCGVGAALQLQLFVAALELWLWRGAKLEDALRTSIKKELIEANKLLNHGVVTLEDADRVAARARQVCSEVIPSLVWEFLEPRLNWDGSLPELATLCRDVSMVDPVCKMGLTSERVVSRTSHSGKTYYFCSESCRKRFGAKPSDFLEASS